MKTVHRFVVVAAISLGSPLIALKPASAITITGSVSGDIFPFLGEPVETRITRLDGSFTIDANAPDQQPLFSNIGTYVLSSFDFSFLNSAGSVVGRLSSANVGIAPFRDLISINLANPPFVPGNVFTLNAGGFDSSGIRRIDGLNLRFTPVSQSILPSDALPTNVLLTEGTGLVSVSNPPFDPIIDIQNVRLTITSASPPTVPPTAIPTPALLPGLVGLGVSMLRQRKQGSV